MSQLSSRGFFAILSKTSFMTFRQRSWQSLTSSALVFFVLTALVLLVGISLSKRLYQQHYLNSEISRLQNEIGAVEKQNAEFSELLRYLQTESFTEEEARLKLGLKKPGEEVVVITDQDDPASKVDNNVGQSNPLKWWFYFFNSQS